MSVKLATNKYSVNKRTLSLLPNIFLGLMLVLVGMSIPSTLSSLLQPLVYPFSATPEALVKTQAQTTAQAQPITSWQAQIHPEIQKRASQKLQLCKFTLKKQRTDRVMWEATACNSDEKTEFQLSLQEDKIKLQTLSGEVSEISPGILQGLIDPLDTSTYTHYNQTQVNDSELFLTRSCQDPQKDCFLWEKNLVTREYTLVAENLRKTLAIADKNLELLPTQPEFPELVRLVSEDQGKIFKYRPSTGQIAQILDM